MCVACRTTAPAVQMLRLARHPDGVVGVDIRAQLPGRGAWVCPTASCLTRSVEKGGLARAFEAPCLVEGHSLCEEVERVLAQEALRGLSIARRMGRLYPGRTEAIDAAARNPASMVIVIAQDLARRSQEEVLAKLSEAHTTSVGATKEEMGSAIGRRPTGVLALAKGPQADALVGDLARLARFRASNGSVPPTDGLPHRDQQTAPAVKIQAAEIDASASVTASNPSEAGEGDVKSVPSESGANIKGVPVLGVDLAGKTKSHGGRNSRALRDVAPKRTSAADETPLCSKATLHWGHVVNESPRIRAVG